MSVTTYVYAGEHYSVHDLGAPRRRDTECRAHALCAVMWLCVESCVRDARTDCMYVPDALNFETEYYWNAIKTSCFILISRRYFTKL